MRKGIAGEILHILHPEAQVMLADVTKSRESARSEVHVYESVTEIGAVEMIAFVCLRRSCSWLR
jgi:hypothetical protein